MHISSPSVANTLFNRPLLDISLGKELKSGNEHKELFLSAFAMVLKSVWTLESMVPQISMRSSPLSSLSTVNCRVHHFLTSEPEEASSFTGFILHTMDFTLVRPEGDSKHIIQHDSQRNTKT